MEDKDVRNICIFVGFALSLMWICSSVDNYNEEKTKQFEIQLEILKYQNRETNFVNGLE